MDNSYVIYARKSSATEDRQILSIDSQIKEMRDLARTQNLSVASVLTESRTAKVPGRPVFGELVQTFSDKKLGGVLCWKPDRLARNPIDSAALIWAIEEGRLGCVITPNRRYQNTSDDKFWLQFDFNMAKKYVDDLSENVQRGNRAKLAQGWLPGPAPIGYLNERNRKIIIPDPERFDLIRKMWEMVLDGTPVPKVLQIATDSWGLRTPPLGRRYGGVPLSRSALYRVLSNPFYYGVIIRNAEVHSGAHKPMISKTEYERVQVLLGKPTRPPRATRRFSYTGLIRCGACGLAVTAEEKINRFGTHYVYYHCSRRRRAVVCRQPSIQNGGLEKQIKGRLGGLQIPTDYLNWVFERAESERKHKNGVQAKAKLSLEGGLTRVEQRLSRLIDLRLDRGISDPEYITKRESLVSERAQFRINLAKLGSNPNHPFEPSLKAFSFANTVLFRFQAGDPEERRYILNTIGSNLSLEDRILLIQPKKPFQLMAETGSRSKWWATWDAVRTWFVEHPDEIDFSKFDFPEVERWKKRKK